MRASKYPLADHSPAKEQLLAIVIARESVITGDTAPLLEKLGFLSESREAAMQWEGRLTFSFDGWDFDPRETAEIPEIRSFFQSLTAEWPYWLHFSEKVGDTVLHVIRLLCHGKYVRRQPGIATWAFADFAEVQQVLLQLFCGQNVMYDRFGLPETMNERITQEVMQLIENSLQ